MRFIRSAAILTLAGAATLAASAGPAAPAFAQGPTVIVTPSTVPPGASAMFTIICDSPTAQSATLYGAPLGLPSHAMNPTSQPGQFIVTVNLPATISPGTYTPSLGCSDGTMRTAALTVTTPTSPTPPPPNFIVINVSPPVVSPGSAVTVTVICRPGSLSATLDASALGLSSQIPLTGSVPGANEFAATVDTPSSTTPGQYSLPVECNPGPGGNGQSGYAHVTVNPVGPPVTGDGTTSSAMGGPFTTAGLALLAAGGLAAGVGVAWKRRRAGAGS
jgi:hypothetical protein